MARALGSSPGEASPRVSSIRRPRPPLLRRGPLVVGRQRRAAPDHGVPV